MVSETNAKSDTQEKDEKEEKATPEQMKAAQEVFDEALKRTGLKRKMILACMYPEFVSLLNTATINMKALSFPFNYAGIAAHCLTQPWYETVKAKAELSISKYRSAVSAEIRNVLNEKYLQRSPQEMKNTNSQDILSRIEVLQKNGETYVFKKAQNTSNKILIGVGLGMFAATAATLPWWAVAAATGGTALSTVLNCKINKKQLTTLISKKSKNNESTNETKQKERQFLEAGSRFHMISGLGAQFWGKPSKNESSTSSEVAKMSRSFFSSVFSLAKKVFGKDRSMDEYLKNNPGTGILGSKAQEEIEAKNAHANQAYLTCLKNNLINGLGSALATCIPLAICYASGSPVTASLMAMTCFAAVSPAIQNFYNSWLEAQGALGEAGLTLSKMEVKDKSFVRGKEKTNTADNVIRLSEDLTYQYHQYDQEGAPLSGRNVFQTKEKIKIEPGVTLLTGASGAGKSTLTTLLERSDLPLTGSLQLGHRNDGGTFVGHDYRELQGVEEQIAVAYQSSPEIPSITVGEYIRVENPNISEERLAEIKNLLGIRKINDGEELQAGEFSEDAPVDKTLSGGQQKRVELARALIKDAPIMILDEPTSGVDATMAKNIVDHIKKLGDEGKTIVYITHTPNEIEACGARQAIDLDPYWSEQRDHTVAKRFDLTDPNERATYVAHFTNRKETEDKEKEEKEKAQEAAQENKTVSDKTDLLRQNQQLRDQLAAQQAQNDTMAKEIETLKRKLSEHQESEQQTSQERHETALSATATATPNDNLENRTAHVYERMEIRDNRSSSYRTTAQNGKGSSGKSSHSNAGSTLPMKPATQRTA